MREMLYYSHISTMTLEEYTKLIQEIMAKDNLEEDYQQAWIPSEPIYKPKIDPLNGKINLTDIKAAQISNAIKNNKTIEIGDFLILITDIDNPKNITLRDIKVFERVYKTGTGRPCNMQLPLNIGKDKRFSKAGFQKLFMYNGAKDLTLEQLVDIIKWIKAVNKLTVFI